MVPEEGGKNPHPLFLLLPLLLALCYPLSWGLEPDALFFFGAGGRILSLFLYILLLFLPFFTAGMITGTMLLLHREGTGLLYGMNLLGSGAGGGLALLLMFGTAPAEMPFAAPLPAALGALLWIGFSPAGPRRIVLGLSAVLPALLSLLLVLGIGSGPAMDQYKDGAYIRELEKQGMAALVCRRPGPRGMIEAYTSGVFHDTLFAGLANPHPPPPQAAILIDGNRAGTLFTEYAPEAEGILDYTPQAIPYGLTEHPRVLLLGEVGGTNIRLARRMGARHITVVQPDRVLLEVMNGELKDLGGAVFSGEDVEVVCADPRTYLEHTGETFDLIQVAQAEGMPAFSGGLFSLREDFLLTVEGIRRALEALSPRGVLAVTRGLQIPPRDSLRIFSTFHTALEATGAAAPADHLVQMQNYLASLTLAFKSPFSRDGLEKLLKAAEPSGSAPVYYPGILPGGPGALPRGIALMAGEDSRTLKETYAFDVTPTDDKPYFHHFYKGRSFAWARENFASLALYHTEIGFLILLAVLAVVAFFSLILVLIPLILLIKRGAGERKLPGPSAAGSVPFFLFIGLGFMFFEMTAIQRLSLFIGDPVFSLSAVISALLLFSGAGSIVQGRLRLQAGGRIRRASAVLAAIMLLYLLFLEDLFTLLAFPGMTARYLVSLLIVMPPAFFMGWFFAPGLELLHRRNRKLVPLAWGVNGAASVVAAPLATLLMITYGSAFTAAVALVLYAAVPLALRGMRE